VAKIPFKNSCISIVIRIPWKSNHLCQSHVPLLSTNSSQFIDNC